MDEATKEFPNRVENVERAHAMAKAEDPYRVLIANAKEKGFNNLAIELAMRRDSVAHNAEKDFDEVATIVENEVANIASWIAMDQNGAHPYAYQFMLDTRADEAGEILEQLYAILNVNKHQSSLPKGMKPIEGRNVYSTNLGYFLVETKIDPKEALIEIDRQGRPKADGQSVRNLNRFPSRPTGWWDTIRPESSQNPIVNITLVKSPQA